MNRGFTIRRNAIVSFVSFVSFRFVPFRTVLLCSRNIVSYRKCALKPDVNKNWPRLFLDLVRHVPVEKQ